MTNGQDGTRIVKGPIKTWSYLEEFGDTMTLILETRDGLVEIYTDGMGLPSRPEARYQCCAVVTGDGFLNAQSLTLQELHNGQPHGRRMMFRRSDG